MNCGAFTTALRPKWLLPGANDGGDFCGEVMDDDDDCDGNPPPPLPPLLLLPLESFILLISRREGNADEVVAVLYEGTRVRGCCSMEDWGEKAWAEVKAIYASGGGGGGGWEGGGAVRGIPLRCPPLPRQYNCGCCCAVACWWMGWLKKIYCSWRGGGAPFIVGWS